MKTLLAILVALTLTVFAQAALPIERVSDQVVVIGTKVPIGESTNFTTNDILKAERTFAQESAQTINQLLKEKAADGFILTGMLPISASTPVVQNKPAIGDLERTGVITAAILVFTKLAPQ